MPQISIIVPVYNAEKYLSRCIDSILIQTYTDFELILINDGSIDGSQDIIEKYSRKDDRIVAINQENMGVSASRNKGISVARGKYIGFVDADDTIEPIMYEKMIGVLSQKDADVVLTNWYIFDNAGRRSAVNLNYRDFVLNHEAFLQKISHENDCWMIHTVWNKLIKVEMVKKYCFDTQILFGEDTWYSYQILFAATKIAVLSEPLYNYYQFDGSASHGGVKGKNRISHVGIYNRIAKDLKEKGNIIYARDVYKFYLDFILREINSNKHDLEYIDELNKIFRREWFKILKCKGLNLKLKVSYLLYILRSFS